MFRIVKHGKSSLRIPVDEFGYVPKEAFMERHQERSRRARVMDERKAAKTVMKPFMTPEDAAEWWADPGRMDIEGIDGPVKAVVIIPPEKPKKARGTGFFGGLRPRKSSYGGLPWLEDPELAEAMAKGELSDEMIAAYLNGTYNDTMEQLGFHESELYDSRNRRKASYSLDPASYFYSQETGKNYTATPQGIAMYADDLARMQGGVDRAGLSSHVRDMMDDTRVIRSHGAHDVLRVGGSRFSGSGRVPIASNNPKRDMRPAFASAETGGEYELSTAGIRQYVEDYSEWVTDLEGQKSKIVKALKEVLQPVPGYATDVDIGDVHDSLEVLY